MASIAIDRSLHGSLREEVQMLRKKVVKLETAGADNERLRKDLSKLQKAKQEEKAQLEMDFMNQLTGVARENALKLEELEGRLSESSKVNRALSEQLADSQTQEMFSKKIKEMETRHKKEIVNIVENFSAEREAMQNQLKIVQESRDELTTRLDDTKLALELKRKELERKASSPNDSNGREQPASVSMQKMLKKAHEENAHLKSTIQSLEVDAGQKQKVHESAIKALEERLLSTDAEIAAKRSEVKRLEMDLAMERRGKRGSFREESSLGGSKVLERENMELKNAAQKAGTARKRQEMTVMQLEKANHDLKANAQRLETENATLQDSISKLKNIKTRPSADPTSRVVTRVVDEMPSQTLQGSTHEKRTTQIIRRLEQNLKKEGQMKQTMTAGLKIRKQRYEGGNEIGTPAVVQDTPDSECPKTIPELQQLLEEERNVTSNLRHEIKDLKSIVSSSKVHQNMAATADDDERDRVSLGSRPVRKDLSVISAGDSTSDIASRVTKRRSGPRTPVRGLVQSFESRISKRVDNPKVGDFEPPTLKRTTAKATAGTVSQLRSTFEANDIEDLKDALNLERQAVLELEEELTRQCEINCSLLKEIGSLTSETESSRKMNVQQFENRNMADQKDVERMSSEISKLKSQLSKTEESKLSLTKKLQETAGDDKRKIDQLQDELNVMRTKVSTAEETRSKLSKQIERGASSDKQEIDRLKLKIRELQSTLSDAEQTIKCLEAQCVSNETDAKQNQQRLEELEKSLNEGSTKVSSQKTRIEGLEKEASDAKNLASELESKQLEVDGLNSLVNELQSNLVNADETKQELEKEKELGRHLDSLVQELKQQLVETEGTCETLTKDKVNQSLVDEEKIDILQAQIETLAKELATVTESRDELENNERIHQEKFDILQTQVEDKVAEFEQTHHADKEAIGRLSEQVQSLQQELTDSFDHIEVLEKQLKQRDEVEETVEELTRKNQKSLDYQINKLQKELTNLQVESSSTEEEYKKKIQGLEEMVESMQSEVDERTGDKERELEDVKRRLENKDTFIARLTKEKEQLMLSMNDMTSSRRSEIDELQTELMEMSTRSANQAREVQTLKLQLEDSSYRKEEVNRLRSRVVELGDQLRARDGSRVHEKTALEVENSDLRQRLRQISLERQTAEDKLREYVEEHKGGGSKSVQVLRERNAALKMEVEKLNRKLKKIYVAEQRRQSSESKNSTKNSVEATRLMI
eukprot:CAMPEP_0117058722 /NCGR_PEP_ID=MMETSP0472-20121206/40792_1 /TAXON_ID=693140 ORGANISM="Tiarina fusus, Strain LIS" /NCGR_SAMPLE_ID=MMETSP0472 /ASSEMBLY_ACC=CAM_ASM_000603 /LENGTH=1220 /DNA_ID=CAMNT_0004776155 /DNA_START=293 /DNA_END=3958 /DNA_ORIENTATION=-